MNIFAASHALVEIEERAKEVGLPEQQVVLFYMWLCDDKFPGHQFDDAFIAMLLREMPVIFKEFDEWAHREALETMKGESEPW